MNYPTFRDIDELRDMINKAEHWGFKQMGRHKIMSPYRKVILAAIRRELTVSQLSRIITKINKLYE